MSEVAEKTAEIVAENVEEVVDEVIEYVDVVRNNPVLIAGALALGLAVGAGGGYFAAKKRLEKAFDERLETEIEEAKEFYQGFNKVNPDGSLMTPLEAFAKAHPGEDLVEEARRAERLYSGTQEDEDELLARRAVEAAQAARDGKINSITVSEETVVTTEPADHVVEQQNVFERERVGNTGGFVLADELPFRTPDKPYIITHTEFFENDPENENVSITYFEGDDTVADENSIPLDRADVERRIGEDHLVMFGRGSRDANIVYIRNEKLSIDYEVVRTPGSYVAEALGMDEPDSLQHSQRRARRALRDADE